ncbi:hypothetical protein M2132_002467 [Dysgonomonas sp. PH5-45]|uniref:BACON domain-containing protein n=1 Tax=unclassified Dysgonomonas TaxID=2630389 RepID=UPI002475ADA9|nr:MULTISPECIES: BACON domain-containing carbohydrate-binding protein [unclassified Dysgonomonas]MDH6356104.1 hypothetical protein [Dysgonomonas sp. PH5-45]MDH6389000.1 hypothetical protein [Dysgonomonas sp. PH5-37]
MEHRYIIIIALFVLVFAGIASCEDIQTETNTDETINLSNNNIELSAKSDSITITSEGAYWWIDHVLSNNEYFAPKLTDIKNSEYHVDGDWFSVKKEGMRTLTIKVKKNTTPYNRKMRISIQSGTHTEQVLINQQGKE